MNGWGDVSEAKEVTKTKIIFFVFFKRNERKPKRKTKLKKIHGSPKESSQSLTS